MQWYLVCGCERKGKIKHYSQIYCQLMKKNNGEVSVRYGIIWNYLTQYWKEEKVTETGKGDSKIYI